jgi:transposase
MANKKRSFSPGFRADAVRLVFEQGRSVADVAQSLDLHVNTLHTWVREAKKGQLTGPRRRSPEQEEIARLRRELHQVTEERDILKKAPVFFANARRSGTSS